MTTITIPSETFDAMREALERTTPKVITGTDAEWANWYAKRKAALSAAKAIVADKSAPREDNIEQLY